ncbi:MAG: transposase [Zestosphaera tikiterensis]|uniref:Transposase n=1 Tax=Zestosphaera tikiterensis TaxID=1973259 RepID=A0A2R7Y8J0_9CREN|nr:MAG: transposase [Zestosphaera tikiterensis]
MVRVARTVVVRSVRLPKRVFKVFVELEGMYRNIVEQLVMYAVSNGVRSFTKLKALKYGGVRNLYPQLPTHYIYTACQDASTRVKSFLKLKKEGIAEKEYPEIKNITIWLDDHLWRCDGYTSINIATHKGWITIDIESHKQYWKYVNRGWVLSSEAKVKLNKRNKQLVIYLTFVKDVNKYKHRGFIPIDVNENSLAMLVNGVAYLFETNMKDVVLGYYYRRKRVQKKYDKLYGKRSRIKRKIFKKLKERYRKNDVKLKIANIIVRAAYEKQYAIVLEDLGEKPAESMIKKIKNDQLRHRIFQASFKGIQKAIEKKAKEYGIPIIYVNPKNTSKTCPIHKVKIRYNNNTRIGKCSKGGELWHRDVVACWNLLIKAYLGDGSDAPSLGRSDQNIDGRVMPLPSTAAHDPIVVKKLLWTRWKSLPQTQNATVLNKMKR